MVSISRNDPALVFVIYGTLKVFKMYYSLRINLLAKAQLFTFIVIRLHELDIVTLFKIFKKRI